MHKAKTAFYLNNSWFLGYDQNQWIIYEHVGDKEEIIARKFIGGSKDSLLTQIERIGIICDGQGKTKLDKLPPRFLDWFKALSTKRC